MDQRKCARQALILMLMALMFVVDMSDPCTNMQNKCAIAKHVAKHAHNPGILRPPDAYIPPPGCIDRERERTDRDATDTRYSERGANERQAKTSKYNLGKTRNNEREREREIESDAR